ncbi:MAG: CRISPR-associated endonuclease Cas2 [Saprospiraceae bacterium]
MYYTVAYDISNDKTRRLAVKLCKKAGLVRVQHSYFMGRSGRLRIQWLRRDLELHLNSETDSLSIQPISKSAFEATVFVGKPIIKDEVIRNYLVVFI